MICRSCKTANMINDRGLVHVEKDEIRAAQTAFTQAEFMHEECLGKCECGHKIGEGK